VKKRNLPRFVADTLAILRLPLTDRQRRVLITLHSFGWNDDGLAFPSVQTIAEESGVSTRHVPAALRKLEELELIECAERGGGRGKTSRYYVKKLTPPGDSVSDPAKPPTTRGRVSKKQKPPTTGDTVSESQKPPTVSTETPDGSGTKPPTTGGVGRVKEESKKSIYTKPSAKKRTSNSGGNGDNARSELLDTEQLAADVEDWWQKWQGWTGRDDKLTPKNRELYSQVREAGYSHADLLAATEYVCQDDYWSGRRPKQPSDLREPKRWCTSLASFEHRLTDARAAGFGDDGRRECDDCHERVPAAELAVYAEANNGRVKWYGCRRCREKHAVAAEV